MQEGVSEGHFFIFYKEVCWKMLIFFCCIHCRFPVTPRSLEAIFMTTTETQVILFGNEFYPCQVADGRGERQKKDGVVWFWIS